MIALGVTTSTARGGAALVRADGEVLGASEYDADDDHAERLFGAIDEAMRAAGLARSQIGRVGCDVGPGSFTGVRVGTATLQSIAWALGIPTIPVSSLAAMAWASDAARCLPVLDARRGEAFYAVYEGGGRVVVEPPALIASTSADVIVEAARRHDARVLGSFAVALLGSTRDSAERMARATELPSAAAIAALAHVLEPAALDPVYVRKPDAKTEAERARARV